MRPALAMPTHAELLAAGAAQLHAAGVDTPRLDAEVLLARASGVDRSGLYARLHTAAADETGSRFASLLDRRARREPIAYITGVQEFWSLPFAVTPVVHIPRPETELVIEAAVRHTREPRPPEGPGGRADAPPRLCDVGTGSGCIAVALARELRDARVVAVDVSGAALELAARNAAMHRVADRIAFVVSDLFDGLAPDLRFDVIASNPPYVGCGEPTSPEIAFEPAAAVAAGGDGLAVIRRLIVEAPRRLRAGGWLVMEFGCEQEVAVRRLAEAAGLADIGVIADLAGLPRVLVARQMKRKARG